VLIQALIFKVGDLQEDIMIWRNESRQTINAFQFIFLLSSGLILGSECRHVG